MSTFTPPLLDRTLDALVALHVLQWPLESTLQGNGTVGHPLHWVPDQAVYQIHPETGARTLNVPPFSHEIALAWQVVERLCTPATGPGYHRFITAMDRLGWGGSAAEVAHRICTAGLEAMVLTLLRARLRAIKSIC